jgi:hypothetical protein
MKHLILYVVFSIMSLISFGQMIMSAEGVKIDNACSPGKVYFLMERRARPIEPIDSIEHRINERITFAKENPDFSGNSSIQFAVNCNGQNAGGFHVVKKSGNDNLDSELIEFFETIENWKAGRRNKKKTVDSWYMWRLEIKDGYIHIQNK